MRWIKLYVYKLFLGIKLNYYFSKVTVKVMEGEKKKNSAEIAAQHFDDAYSSVQKAIAVLCGDAVLDTVVSGMVTDSKERSNPFIVKHKLFKLKTLCTDLGRVYEGLEKAGTDPYAQLQYMCSEEVLNMPHKHELIRKYREAQLG